MDTNIIGSNSGGQTVATDIFIALYQAGGGSGVTQSITASNVMPIAGTFSNFYIQCDAGPGGGITRTFWIYKNGSNTGISISLTGAGTGAGVSTGNDVANAVSFAIGDLISIHTTATGTTTSTGTIRWCLDANSPIANQSMVLGNAAVALTVGSTNFVPIQGKGLDLTAGTNEQGVMPTAGTFKNAYMKSSGAVGSGKNYVATLYQNGNPTSIAMTISGAGVTTATDTTHSVSVSAGDTFYWSIAADAGSSSVIIAISMEFDPTTNGESVHTYGSSVATTNSAARFQSLQSPNAAAYQAAESTRQDLTLAAVWKKLYVNLTTAPGGSASYQFQLSLNATPGNPSTTISAAATTGNDTVNTVTSTVGQTVAMKITPATTPAATVLGYGIVSSIALPTATSNKMMMTGMD